MILNTLQEPSFFKSYETTCLMSLDKDVRLVHYLTGRDPSNNLWPGLFKAVQLWQDGDPVMAFGPHTSYYGSILSSYLCSQNISHDVEDLNGVLCPKLKDADRYEVAGCVAGLVDSSVILFQSSPSVSYRLGSNLDFEKQLQLQMPTRNIRISGH